MSRQRKRFLERMKKKLFVVFLIAMLGFVALIIRVAYLEIAKGKNYSEQVLSQKQYESLEIPYERGEIVDRNGNVLATNEKVYNLIIEPKNILSSDKGREATYTALNKFFGIDKETYDSYMQRNDSLYCLVKKEIAYADVQAFREYCDTNAGKDVVGVWFEDQYKRTYPNNSLACHILGYTVSGNVGQGGIEGYYNSYLNGTNGKTYGYLTNDNTVQSVTVPAVDGYTVVSTIDLNIQKIVEDNIKQYMQETGAKKIGVVAMDPDNGEVLSMASSYSYDPNDPMDTSKLRNMTVKVSNPAKRQDTTEEASTEDASTEDGSTEEESSEETSEETSEEDTSEDGSTEEASTEEIPEELEYDFSQMTDAEFKSTLDSFDSTQLYEALNSLWRNFCISDNFEPGSTFKPFTVAGAIEDDVVQDGDTFYCDGYQQIGEDRIYCHNRSGDGMLTVRQALEQSCNDGLMQIAAKEGASTFDKYQELFGIGSYTGIDLYGESVGAKFDADKLNPTELATSSFGQGVNVTMIQMAAGFCSIINGGNYYTPHVAKQILDNDGSIIEAVEPELVRKTISKSTSDLLKSYLAGVVTDGTGKRAAVDGYTIGGKTGTAEKLPRGTGRYILSFIGFSPVEHPQIMVYVVVDEPDVESQSTSGAGALLFHAIMEDLLPYMNVYQSSDETIVPDGNDEPIGSAFDETGDTTGTGDGTEPGSEAGTDTTTETTTEAGTGDGTGNYVDPVTGLDE